jgi:hypothetical protein
MMMGVFWDAAPSSLLDFDRYSEELTASIIREMINLSNYGGNKLLRNVGQYPPDYTAQHYRRQPSSRED